MAISDTKPNDADMQRALDFALLPEVRDLNRQVYEGLIHPIEYVQHVVALAVQHGVNAEHLMGRPEE